MYNNVVFNIKLSNKNRRKGVKIYRSQEKENHVNKLLLWNSIFQIVQNSFGSSV